MAQPFRNRILTSLAEDDLGRLLPHLHEISLNIEHDVITPATPISHLYFPESGLLSVVAGPDGGEQLEVGLIGRDGASGLMVLLGVDQSPLRTFVQKSGTAHRIASGLVEDACQASPTLRRALLRYVQAFSIQAAETARASAKFTVEERLARWLLMAHDRSEGDDVTLTHDFLALMLGVRRPGVTVATHVLEGNGLIRARRGSILVLDRAGLIKAARGCYGVSEAEYERIFQISARNGAS